jgi:hypothetical protein
MLLQKIAPIRNTTSHATFCNSRRQLIIVGQNANELPTYDLFVTSLQDDHR